jgi:two-component system chemotaxis response regulator CheB
VRESKARRAPLPPIRVLIVDELPVARKVLADGLGRLGRLEVVATAPNSALGARKAVAARPDVVVLDAAVAATGADGLRDVLIEHGMPVLLLSALGAEETDTIARAFQVEPAAVLRRRASNVAEETGAGLGEIARRVARLHQDRVLYWRRRCGSAVASPVAPWPVRSEAKRIVAIGASTGGTEALCLILSRLPRETPGTLIVQHMPPGFTRMFAARLDELSRLSVTEAQDGDVVRPGHVLVAPGGRHMRLVMGAGAYRVRVEVGQAVSGHCPSVDVLMSSVARTAGANAVGIVLTGMGADGAKGLAALREAGGRTLAQDKASSVVFGMPGEAWKRGGVERLVALDDMARQILALLAH